MNDIRPPTMTYAQTAAMLHRSVSTIERWVSTGFIPHHRVGARSIRFDRNELEQWLRDNELDADGFAPARPLKKRPGAQYVFPHQTLGDDVHCWCGDVLDHDWPGKKSGVPHPHEHEGIQQVVVVEQTNPQPEWHRIEKGALRGYHAALKNFLVKCINTDGLHWRHAQTRILLYPPDGSQPIAVHCRNSDQQMRSLNIWYTAHVKPYVGDVGTPETRASEAEVRKLAQTVNDPDEHPVREPEPESNVRPYVTTEGVASEWFVTDGAMVWCKACVGTETEYNTPVGEVRGIGGHVRMMHRDTSTLRTAEALEKSVDSRRFNRLQEKVTVAVELLAETVGIDLVKNADAGQRIAELEHEVQKQTRRADDAETKLRLMKEAFRGLE